MSTIENTRYEEQAKQEFGQLIEEYNWPKVHSLIMKVCDEGMGHLEISLLELMNDIQWTAWRKWVHENGDSRDIMGIE